jgi:hypothetical protein
MGGDGHVIDRSGTHLTDMEYREIYELDCMLPCSLTPWRCKTKWIIGQTIILHIIMLHP